MQIAAIWPGPSFKKQLISHCQDKVQGLDPWHWIGRNDFSCHVYAMAYVLYRCAPHLLIPVREKILDKKQFGSAYYAAFLTVTLSHLIGPNGKQGLTYADLAREDGWHLPKDFTTTREQMLRLGELLDQRIRNNGFLLVEKDFHGEAVCLSPYDDKQVEMKSKTYTLELWRVGEFEAWFDRVISEGKYQPDQLLLSDMINYNQGILDIFSSSLAGMQELDALLAKMPIEKIIEQAEEEYPRFRDRYYD